MTETQIERDVLIHYDGIERFTDMLEVSGVTVWVDETPDDDDKTQRQMVIKIAAVDDLLDACKFGEACCIHPLIAAANALRSSNPPLSRLLRAKHKIEKEAIAKAEPTKETEQEQGS